MIMAKQRTARTKFQVEEAKNKLLIEKRINELKKELRRHTITRIGTMYKILSEIVKLRKPITTKKRYTFRSLEFEEDIHLSGSQLRYIEAYKYISPKSKELIESNVIDDNTICYMVYKVIALRDHGLQDKAVENYLNGNLQLSRLGELKKKRRRKVCSRKTQKKRR